MNEGKMEKMIEKERMKMGFKKARINEIPYSNFNTSNEWIACFKLNSEIKIERDETVNKMRKLIEQGAPRAECPSFSDCSYVRKIMDLEIITPKEANLYLTFICENYSGACQLNKL